MPLAWGTYRVNNAFESLKASFDWEHLLPGISHIGKLLAGKQRDNNNRADSQARKKCADISSSRFVIATETGREQQSCNYKQLCKTPALGEALVSFLSDNRTCFLCSIDNFFKSAGMPVLPVLHQSPLRQHSTHGPHTSLLNQPIHTTNSHNNAIVKLRKICMILDTSSPHP